MPKKIQKKKPIILGNPIEVKNNLSEINTLLETENLYETVLERLEKEFPHVPEDLIEEIYEKNARSYISTKKTLEEIFPKEANDKINFNKNQNDDYNNKPNSTDYFKDKDPKLNSNLKESDTNFTDETDKFSSKTEKSKNEKSEFSNELSRQISGTNSNFSGNLNLDNGCFNIEENSNTKNYTNYSNQVKKANKKFKNRAYNISDLICNNENYSKPNNKNQNEFYQQGLYEDSSNTQNISKKPLNELIAFKFEDNFISSDEEKIDKTGKNQFNKNIKPYKNKNIIDKEKVSNFNFTNKNYKKNNNQTIDKFDNNKVQNNGKTCSTNHFEIAQSNSSKNLNTEEIISNYFSIQKKGSDQYRSVFDENLLIENLTNNLNIYPNTNFSSGEQNNIPGEFNIYYFEELLLEYYIKVISEFFPNLSSTEIMEKICEFDFDIDGLVISLLDINNETTPGELNKLANNDISEDLNLDIFKNFYFEENADYEAFKDHNLQLQIEQQIKKNVNNNSNQIKINNKTLRLIDLIPNDEVNCNNGGKEEEEYFLDKPISSIETKAIRDDLIKLSNALPLVEEMEIKWVYYQFMDYSTSLNHFLSLSGEAPIISNKSKLSKIFQAAENSNKANKFKAEQNSQFTNNNKFINQKNPDSFTSSNGSKKYLSTSSNSGSNENSFTNNLYKIMNENPKNWKFENNGKFRLSEYQELRRKLIYQAQLAWRSGRHQDAKVIMAKAKRYKEDINFLLKNKKLEIFLRNNEHHGILNMINKRENFIDVHGLNFEEAKILINKKIGDIKKKKIDGTLDESRRFCLSIITGVGNHSVGNKPVLMPKLNKYYSNYDSKTDWQNGIVKVFI